MLKDIGVVGQSKAKQKKISPNTDKACHYCEARLSKEKIANFYFM